MAQGRPPVAPVPGERENLRASERDRRIRRRDRRAGKEAQLCCGWATAQIEGDGRSHRCLGTISSIWIERMEDGVSVSGLNQRLGTLSFTPTTSGAAPRDGMAKPDVRVFGLWETTPWCRFSCSKASWFSIRGCTLLYCCKKIHINLTFGNMKSTCCICMSLSEGRDRLGEVAEDDQGGVLLSPS